MTFAMPRPTSTTTTAAAKMDRPHLRRRLSAMSGRPKVMGGLSIGLNAASDIGSRLAEEVTDGQQHFPFGAGEVHERQRLVHLDVKPRVERWAIGGRIGAARSVREPIADAI